MTNLIRLGDRRSGLGPPRFRLGTLLLIVTGICIVLASYTWVGAYGATLVALLLLAIMAHVAGNWLGNQLRAIGDQPGIEDDESESPVVHGLAKGHIQPQHFAPASSLHGHTPLSKFVLFAVLFAIVCGASGGVWLVWIFTNRPTWAMLICGGAAFGVLAGIWSFLVAAFVHSGWRALSQATRHK